LGSRSPREDQRFLGRCGSLMPGSWIVVRVFKAKSGGYPKVNGPTEFLPGGTRPSRSTLRCPVRRPSKQHSPHSRDAGRGLSRTHERTALQAPSRADNTHVSRALMAHRVTTFSPRTAGHRPKYRLKLRPALRDSAAASLTSDCGSSWPQLCGGEHR
jgi:hypothetical protein